MQSCAQITRQVTLPFWPHTAASLSEEPSQAWQDKMPCQRVTVIYSKGSWHEELGVYDSDAVLLPAAQGCVRHALLSQWQEGLQLDGRRHVGLRT